MTIELELVQVVISYKSAVFWVSREYRMYPSCGVMEHTKIKPTTSLSSAIATMHRTSPWATRWLQIFVGKHFLHYLSHSVMQGDSEGVVGTVGPVDDHHCQWCESLKFSDSILATMVQLSV